MSLGKWIAIISCNLPIALVTLSATLLGGIVGHLTTLWLQDVILTAL